MKKVFIILLIFTIYNINIYCQNPTYNLKHLTKTEFSKQIKNCIDSAYGSIGVEVIEINYDGQNYDFIVNFLNEIIDKRFNDKISHDENGKNDITYSLIWTKYYNGLKIGLDLKLREKSIAGFYILYGTMTENSMKGFITIYKRKNKRYLIDTLKKEII